MQFSISRLTRFLNCPASYKFNYVDKIPWDFTPADMSFGSAIHETLEKFHNNGIATKESLVKDFESRWNDALKKPNLRFNKLNGVELRDRGRQLVLEYYNQFKDIKVQEAELYFEIPLIDLSTGQFEGHLVHGKIDMIAENIVHEIKTSGRSYSQQEADESLQLTWYAFAYQLLYNRKPENLKFVVLIKTKVPKIQILETTRTQQDFTRLHQLMTNAIKTIQLSAFYPNPLTKYGCGGCPFQSVCGNEG